MEETYTEIIDGEAVEKPLPQPLPPTHEEVSNAREKAYESLVDHLHLRKIRKTVLGEWTEELEAEYVEEVKELSAKIAELHPYPEDIIAKPEAEEELEGPVEVETKEVEIDGVKIEVPAELEPAEEE